MNQLVTIGTVSTMALVFGCSTESPPAKSANAVAAGNVAQIAEENTERLQEEPSGPGSSATQAANAQASCPIDLPGVVVSASSIDGGAELAFVGGPDREALRRRVEALGDAYEDQSERAPHAAAAPEADATSGPTSDARSPDTAEGAGPRLTVACQVNYEATPGGAKLEFLPTQLQQVEPLRAMIAQHARIMASDDRCPELG